MKSKKICKLLCPIAGILSFMISTGMCTMPAYAAENTAAASQIISNNAYNCTLPINKSVEMNGVKITVLDVAATKNHYKTRLKFECKNKIDDSIFDNSYFQQIYGNDNYCSNSENHTIIDDHTFICEIDNQADSDYEYDAVGTIRIDIVIPNLDINKCIKVPVDLTEQFKNVKTIYATKNISCFDDMNITKIEQSSFGTDIYYKLKIKEDNNEDCVYNNNYFYIVKGDKFYKATECNSDISEDNNYQIGYYRSNSIKYSPATTDDSVRIIPIEYKIAENELNEIIKNDDDDTKKDTINENNIHYKKDFKFNDNTTGQIYKIEKSDKKLKVYCKADTENKSFIMADNLYVDYFYGDNVDNIQNDYYDQDENSFIYKDPNEKNGYVIECNNIDTSKEISVSISSTAAFNSDYTIGSEIELK